MRDNLQVWLKRTSDIERSNERRWLKVWSDPLETQNQHNFQQNNPWQEVPLEQQWDWGFPIEEGNWMPLPMQPWMMDFQQFESEQQNWLFWIEDDIWQFDNSEQENFMQELKKWDLARIEDEMKWNQEFSKKQIESEIDESFKLSNKDFTEAFIWFKNKFWKEIWDEFNENEKRIIFEDMLSQNWIKKYEDEYWTVRDIWWYQMNFIEYKDNLKDLVWQYTSKWYSFAVASIKANESIFQSWWYFIQWADWQAKNLREEIERSKRFLTEDDKKNANDNTIIEVDKKIWLLWKIVWLKNEYKFSKEQMDFINNWNALSTSKNLRISAMHFDNQREKYLVKDEEYWRWWSIFNAFKTANNFAVDAYFTVRREVALFADDPAWTAMWLFLWVWALTQHTADSLRNKTLSPSMNKLIEQLWELKQQFWEDLEEKFTKDWNEMSWFQYILSDTLKWDWMFWTSTNLIASSLVAWLDQALEIWWSDKKLRWDFFTWEEVEVLNWLIGDWLEYLKENPWESAKKLRWIMRENPFQTLSVLVSLPRAVSSWLRKWSPNLSRKVQIKTIALQRQLSNTVSKWLWTKNDATIRKLVNEKWLLPGTQKTLDGVVKWFEKQVEIYTAMKSDLNKTTLRSMMRDDWALLNSMRDKLINSSFIKSVSWLWEKFKSWVWSLSKEYSKKMQLKVFTKWTNLTREQFLEKWKGIYWEKFEKFFKTPYESSPTKIKNIMNENQYNNLQSTLREFSRKIELQENLIYQDLVDFRIAISNSRNNFNDSYSWWAVLKKSLDSVYKFVNETITKTEGKNKVRVADKAYEAKYEINWKNSPYHNLMDEDFILVDWWQTKMVGKMKKMSIEERGEYLDELNRINKKHKLDADWKFSEVIEDLKIQMNKLWAEDLNGWRFDDLLTRHNDFIENLVPWFKEAKKKFMKDIDDMTIWWTQYKELNALKAILSWDSTIWKKWLKDINIIKKDEFDAIITDFENFYTRLLNKEVKDTIDYTFNEVFYQNPMDVMKALKRTDFRVIKSTFNNMDWIADVAAQVWERWLFYTMTTPIRLIWLWFIKAWSKLKIGWDYPRIRERIWERQKVKSQNASDFMAKVQRYEEDWDTMKDVIRKIKENESEIIRKFDDILISIWEDISKTNPNLKAIEIMWQRFSLDKLETAYIRWRNLSWKMTPWLALYHMLTWLDPLSEVSYTKELFEEPSEQLMEIFERDTKKYWDLLSEIDFTFDDNVEDEIQWEELDNPDELNESLEEITLEWQDLLDNQMIDAKNQNMINQDWWAEWEETR